MRVLCVDIGNTNTKYGYYRKERCLTAGSVKTGSVKSLVDALRELRIPALDMILICSVVPAFEKTVVQKLKKLFSITPQVIGASCVIEVQTRYKKKSLGNDRIVNMWGAVCAYPAPCVVVSFGTAITIDYINAAGVHMGGVIFPGLETARKAVCDKAAQLAYTAQKTVSPQILGTDTPEAIDAGVVYGVAAGVDGIVARMVKRARKPVTVLGVGGDAAMMKRYCTSLTTVDVAHTLDSLCLLAHAIAEQ